MESLWQLGVSDRFEQKALAWTHGTSYYQEKPVYRLEMPHSEQERFYPMYNLQQQYIEQYLVEKAEAEDLVELRWGSKLAAIEQHATRVVLGVDTPDGSGPARPRVRLRDLPSRPE